MHVCMCVVCVCVRACARVYVHTYIHIYAHTHTHLVKDFIVMKPVFVSTSLLCVLAIPMPPHPLLSADSM